MANTMVIGLRLESGQDPDEIMAALSGLPGISEPLDLTAQIGVVASLANLETWDERCARQAIEDYGFVTRADIEEHIASAQSDLDYLTGQDEALELLINMSRKARGSMKDRSQIISEAMQAAGMDPEPDADEPDGPGQ